MYWTAIVVEPTYLLLQEAAETQQAIEKRANQSVKQNQLLIENQNANTERLESIIANQSNLMDNQIVVIKNVGNSTEKLGIILEFFRTNFNETFLHGEDLERQATKSILGNVTQIRNILLLQDVRPNQTLLDVLIEKQIRAWVDELRANLSAG